MYGKTLEELFDLDGRTAFVNAGTGYLGPALCEALAEAGARVFCTSRSEERARAVAAALPGRADHVGIAMDHLDPESVDEAMKRSFELTDCFDILVNNANDIPVGLLDDVTPADFSRGLDNATGYFSLARHVKNRAVEAGKPASIVMISSMYGMVSSNPEVYERAGGGGNPLSYQVMKAGVIQMVRHLAVYWAKDGIRVNSISPGPFNRPQAKRRVVEEIVKQVPLKRSGKPEELKGALLLLASDAGSYITGTNLVVDGGWSAW